MAYGAGGRYIDWEKVGAARLNTMSVKERMKPERDGIKEKSVKKEGENSKKRESN